MKPPGRRKLKPGSKHADAIVMASSLQDEATRGDDGEDVEVIARAREERREGYQPDRRELSCELALAVAFLGCAVTMALALPARIGFNPLAAALLVVLALLCLHIDFEVGPGRTHPLQLAFVPMLFVLPARTVPLLVAAVYVLATLIPALRSPRRALGSPRRALRAIPAVSDCWFSIAPALVFALTPEGRLTAAGLLAAALASQLLLDGAVSALRLRIGLGMALGPQVRAFAWTYLVDALLAPIGLLAALAARHAPLYTLLVLPLGALLAILASERQRRIDTALELHRVVGESEARLQSILQHSSDMIAITDPDGRLRSATGAAGAVLGSDTGTGSSLLDRVHPADAALVRAFLRDASLRRPAESPSATFQLRFADGHWRHVETTASNLLADHRVRGLVLTIRDVNERAALEQQLRHRAFHDVLTGLPNRALFYDRIEHALHVEQREHERCAVLFVDLNGFRLVNERLGREGGDEVLVAAAQRLRELLSTADTAARVGGDEFGVLLERAGGVASCVTTAERILRAFVRPVVVGDETVQLRPSVGVAIREPGAADPDELLRQADLAMYAAKQLPEPAFALFSPELEAGRDEAAAEAAPERGVWFSGAREQRAEIEHLLASPDALHTVFQPIVDLRTGEIAGYEALSRFAGPVSRPPNHWFAQAHRSGLGYELEAHAIEVALRASGRPSGTLLSINLSPSALVSPEAQAVLPDDLHGVMIEITENELVFEHPTFTTTIASLRARGAQLAIDDAGAGYAGLKQLMALKPDMIKLDRALIDGIAANPAKVALVDSFVGYAERIGATLCAEGIESLEDLALLADLDVSYGQGFGLARPAEPWATIDPKAADCCRAGLSRALARDVDPSIAAHRGDGTLARLTARLGAITTAAELIAIEPELAFELHCDRVVVSSIAPDQDAAPGRELKLADRPLARTVLAGGQLALVGHADNAADPTERARLGRSAMHSVLLAPITCGSRTLGLLEAFRADERPWSRRETVRARMLAGQVGDVLDRLTAGRATPPTTPAGAGTALTPAA